MEKKMFVYRYVYAISNDEIVVDFINAENVHKAFKGATRKIELEYGKGSSLFLLGFTIQCLGTKEENEAKQETEVTADESNSNGN